MTARQIPRVYVTEERITFRLVVLPERGEGLYAEIEPAGSRWLPWPGRTSRWWYEVHTEEETYAYEPGGSGGSFTLSGCIKLAAQAVAKFAVAEEA